jgi:F0F1-type ATP synthase membrane subunit b/b'
MGFLGTLFTEIARKAIKEATVGKITKELNEAEKKVEYAKTLGKDTLEAEEKLKKAKEKMPEITAKTNGLIDRVI